MDHPEQVEMAGGKAASSKIPPFHLIPTVALEKTAERFRLGVERKGDKSWNAVSDNQEILEDKEFLIERIAHIIHHAAKLRDKLKSGDEAAMETDDDASAIVWGGMFLQCAVERLCGPKQHRSKKYSCYNCGNPREEHVAGKCPKKEAPEKNDPPQEPADDPMVLWASLAEAAFYEGWGAAKNNPRGAGSNAPDVAKFNSWYDSDARARMLRWVEPAISEEGRPSRENARREKSEDVREALGAIARLRQFLEEGTRESSEDQKRANLFRTPLETALEWFVWLMDKHSHLGANDTETVVIWNKLLLAVVNRHPYTIPHTPSAWGLSRHIGGGAFEAAIEMGDMAKQVLRIVSDAADQNLDETREVIYETTNWVIGKRL